MYDVTINPRVAHNDIIHWRQSNWHMTLSACKITQGHELQESFCEFTLTHVDWTLTVINMPRRESKPKAVIKHLEMEMEMENYLLLSISSRTEGNIKMAKWCNKWCMMSKFWACKEKIRIQEPCSGL